MRWLCRMADALGSVGQIQTHHGQAADCDRPLQGSLYHTVVITLLTCRITLCTALVYAMPRAHVCLSSDSSSLSKSPITSIVETGTDVQHHLHVRRQP